MKVFLLGGTKDSINIIQHIKENYDYYILTTTTTEYGGKLAKEGGSDDTIARPLLKDEIRKILINEDFDLLIDATHPFAEHITQTSASLARELDMPYIRFERPTTNLEGIDTSNIHYVKSFDEAGKLIADDFNEGNILHFAGANTMADILNHVSVERFYPRILKVESSIRKCESLNVDPDHIIPMTGAATVEENLELIEKYDANKVWSLAMWNEELGFYYGKRFLIDETTKIQNMLGEDENSRIVVLSDREEATFLIHF